MSATLPSPFPNSPFASDSATKPGHGEVVLSLLPPANPSLSKLSYRYPLKLVSRMPSVTLNSKYPPSATTPVHLYLLTYGGGLLPGDYIDVSITLRPRTRLVINTPQGTTKIFKTRSRDESGDKYKPHNGGDPGNNNGNADGSQQNLDVCIRSEAGLCFLPDPCTPFEDSRYEQIQVFTVLHDEEGDNITSNHNQSNNTHHPPNTADINSAKPDKRPSLCVLDWVTEGRSARGENWSFHSWKGRNEIWIQRGKSGRRKLLVRDSVILDDGQSSSPSLSSSSTGSNEPMTSTTLPIRTRTDPHKILGTLILYGPLFDDLGAFFMEEFSSQPRIGGRNWSASAPTTQQKQRECAKDVIWTAARVRSDIVLVKFGAKDYQTARDWLGGLLRQEGSIEREFGPEAYGSL
ncbi:hypothetical protein AJ80_06378 [Polytolypa hystricis UAMH7299]|uniref:Urease accessory protein UreD n=1 Tax=Polytolypa hystricis (strain UAMH7299) TaxID=1447883 RepID=A0A2B7XXH6_POLH7|nr:hypothetical protein AJ80_06378 [Polytolypa hystricis UAMH7299]